MKKDLEISASAALAELHEGQERNKILCVDNDKDIRDLVERFIPHCIPGYEVVTARDGVDALDQISDDLGKEIALIFSDIIMPNMDGLELACALKNEVSLNNVPFIICTGSAGNYQIPGTSDYGQMQELKDQGAVDEVMGKPFMINSVQKAVQKAIENVKKRNFGVDQKSG